MKRRLAFVVGIALALTLLAWPAAQADYLGSDLVGNISPESQTPGGLVDRYPLSAYSLDYHVDAGVTDPGGVPPMIAQWAAAQIWSLSSFLVKTVIDLFTWAFSLDLLAGDPGRAGGGALAPVGEAIASVYENVIGEAWMVTAILIAGLWGIWKALVQRRYTETAGALAISVLFVLIALFFVYQPVRTVGEASKWTNTLSLAFLSGANRGSLDDPEQAKRQVADHLFETLVYRPWVVLEFGGLRHCVDTDRPNDDGYPLPVGPHDPSRDACRDHVLPSSDGYGGYASRFLRQPAGSDRRDREYSVLRKGELPFPSTSQFTGYQVSKADSPAVDIQQAGGAYQRLTFVAIVFVGTLGAVALLGFLALAVILAQVVALVLLGFAPVALVIGIFPGAGHAFFRGWLTKLATAIFIKALYSLVIAIVVAVSAALAASTGSLGFLFAFGLQATFFWAIFLYRKQITAQLVSATTGGTSQGPQPRMTAVHRGAQIAGKPFGALVGYAGGRAGKQESVLAGGTGTSSPNGAGSAPDPHDPSSPPATSSNGHDPSPTARDNGAPGRLRSGDPLRANGSPSGPAPTGDAPPPSQPSVPTPRSADPHTAAPTEHAKVAAAGERADAQDSSPRALHAEMMHRARELRERRAHRGDGQIP